MNDRVKGYTIRPDKEVRSVRLANALSALRRILGGDRFSGLVSSIKQTIQSLRISNPKMLDYGCGAMGLSQALLKDGVVADFVGMDIFPSPAKTGEDAELWARYRQIPISGNLPVHERYNVAIIVDALHHADESQHVRILESVALVADFVIVKDHFEYGPISRQLLRLADAYGNFAFGVNVPARYFTQKRWADTVNRAGLTQTVLKIGVPIHQGLFRFVIRPKFHFIAILQKPQA